MSVPSALAAMAGVLAAAVAASAPPDTRASLPGAQASGIHAVASAVVGLLGAEVSGAGLGTPAAGERPRWQWPVEPRPEVARPFVAPLSPYGAGHRGLDLTASEGVAVLAVEGGVVTHAGVIAGRGTVSIEHADGLRSTYEPVTASVAGGDVVTAGQRIGTLEATAGHCGPRGCLHLGARRGETYLDPLPLLAGGRIILLPFH
jgi:murein DD-endopeptidase MepM/ murein hydrolase activator NlpD